MRSLNLQQNWDLDLFRVRGDWLKLVLCLKFRRNLPSWPRIRTIGLLLYFDCTKQIQFLSVCRLGHHSLKDPRQPARGSWTLEFCEGVVGFVLFSWNAPNTHVCFVCWHELPNIYVHYVGLAIDPKRAVPCTIRSWLHESVRSCGLCQQTSWAHRASSKATRLFLTK